MLNLNTLASLHAVAHMVASSVRWRFAVSQAIIILALTILLGVLASVFLVAGFHIIYIVLLAQGWNAVSAMAMIGLAAAVFTLILGGVLAYMIHRLHYRLFRKPFPNRIGEAFLDGFSHPAD